MRPGICQAGYYPLVKTLKLAVSPSDCWGPFSNQGNLPGKTWLCGIKPAMPAKTYRWGRSGLSVRRDVLRKSLSFINFAAREINCRLCTMARTGRQTDLVHLQKTAGTPEGR